MKPSGFLDSKWPSVLGMAGPAFAIAAIFAGIALSPWFSFWDNALSDMGHSSSSVAPLFNGALIGCGICVAVFSLSLIRRFRKERLLARASAFLLLLTAFALAGIGVFPTGSPHSLHTIFAFLFFLMVPVTALPFGVYFLKISGKPLALVSFLATALAISSVFAPHGQDIAIPELVLILPAVVWIIALAVWDYKRLEGASTPNDTPETES